MALDATGTTLCPVASLLDYLNAQSGTPGPPFIHQDGTPLHWKWFGAKVQQALLVAGVPVASMAIALELEQLQQPVP